MTPFSTEASLGEGKAARKPGHPVVRWLLATLVLLAVAAAAFIFPRAPGSDISYEGRPIGAWFSDFLDSDWQNSLSDTRTNRPALAFLEMEGDAVPFLAYQCHRGWSAFDRAYPILYQKLPRKIKAVVPAPRLDPREAALWLLGAIGRTQNVKAWDEKPSSKRPMRQAIPAIRKALADPALRGSACRAIEDCGPALYEAIPDLMRLVAADYTLKRLNSQVLRALGAIGPAASNAVPLLCAIAADQTLGPGRLAAARALGDIGTPARSAAPILGSLLVQEGFPGGWFLVDALARLGETPEETVPLLRREIEQGNPLAQVYAVVALWNREPGNPDLQADINARLMAAIAAPRGPQEPTFNPHFLAGPLLATLRARGTNAAVFAPAIRRIARSGDRALTNSAVETLRAVEGDGRVNRPTQRCF